MSRVALITGAGRGIGAATARELGGRGFHVIVNYVRDAASARTVVKDVEAAGGTARAVQADVFDPEQAGRLVDACPRVDALVCNANRQPPFATLEDMTWEAFHGKLSDELAGAFHVSRAALPRMRERRAGTIVYVSSLSAELTRPGAIAHSSAKAALNAFARHVALEAAPYGITVNTIAPGAVATDATAGVFTPEARAAFAENSVLRRVMEPADVARAIAATVEGGLEGGAFAGVTGARIPVDGGYRVISGNA
ncbi:SDR family NAD(P)-dependent oxidoreductase [Actinomadura rugatobispora]|uniref:SDR family NAD(P)-dependent oxidoreductase n=1 Tax=Actinomadura rugatobispora TaxID=1994 RepID=A0ABW1A1A1_9ACTN|nr:SDR family oxidoreductase [Actinomadura rugatobispora]